MGVGGTDADGSESGGDIAGIASTLHNKSAVRYRMTIDGPSPQSFTPPASVVVGKTYGGARIQKVHWYTVTALSIYDSAPSGTYTFYAPTYDAGSVELKRDGVVIDTLSYDWQTTIGEGSNYTFDFPGHLQLTIAKNGPGTMNLYWMPESLFNDA